VGRQVLVGRRLSRDVDAAVGRLAGGTLPRLGLLSHGRGGAPVDGAVAGMVAGGERGLVGVEPVVHLLFRLGIQVLRLHHAQVEREPEGADEAVGVLVADDLD
jgi:hypothetical protein